MPLRLWSRSPSGNTWRSPKLIENSARGHWENPRPWPRHAACGMTVTGLLLMKEMASHILLLGALRWVALAGTGASSPASGRRARAAVVGLLKPAVRVGRSRGRASPRGWRNRHTGPRARACRPHRRVGRPTSIRAMVSALATRMVSSSSDGIRRQTQPSALSFLAPTPSSRIISVAVRPVYTASSLSILAGISALLPRQRPQAR